MKKFLLIVALLCLPKILMAEGGMVLRRPIYIAAAGGGGGGGCAAVGSAVSFVSSANNTPGTRANSIVNVPAGVAVDDVMIADIHYEANSPTITPPSDGGWRLAVSTGNVGTTPDAWGFTYVRRSTGTEPASYKWTHASGFEGGVIAAYRNVNTGCGPDDVNASSAVYTTSGAGNWTVKQITTTYDNDHLVIMQDNYEGNPSGQPAGWNERMDNSQLSVQDLIQATAGASGDKTGSVTATTHGALSLLGLID